MIRDREFHALRRNVTVLLGFFSAEGPACM